MTNPVVYRPGLIGTYRCPWCMVEWARTEGPDCWICEEPVEIQSWTNRGGVG